VASPERVDQALLENKLAGIRVLQEQLHRLKFQKFDRLFPDEGPLRRELYAKHMEFFEAGKSHMTRTLSGGNRVGKTEGCAYEVAAHVTGNYKPWWPGRVITRPFQSLVSGTDGKKVRKSIQKKLLGWPGGEKGSGLIPRDRIEWDLCRLDHGTANLYESIFVKHKDGYLNEINVLTYKAGREAFESTEPMLIWEDEEPDVLLHRENIQRLMTNDGFLMLSYTPIKGLTELTREMRLRGKDPEDEQAWYGQIAWDDVPHITPEMIERYKSEFPRYEMAARRYGEPKMGSGAIFTRPWDEVSVPPFRIPDWWPRFYGLDFGWKHPTAALWFAWDREEDVMYVYSEHRVAEAVPPVHAVAIQARGDWIRGSADHNASIENGKRMIDIYNGLGLHLVPADKAMEAGLLEVTDRLATDRLKFFNTLPMTQGEYETYHTDEKGKIVGEADDLMSALRYGVVKGPQIAKTRPPKRRPDSGVKAVKFSERKLF